MSPGISGLSLDERQVRFQANLASTDSLFWTPHSAHQDRAYNFIRAKGGREIRTMHALNPQAHAMPHRHSRVRTHDAVQDPRGYRFARPRGWRQVMVNELEISRSAIQRYPRVPRRNRRFAKGDFPCAGTPCSPRERTPRRSGRAVTP